MTDGRDEFIVERFEEQRPRLRAVAFRMLGSAAEADDALQEAWLRVSKADAPASKPRWVVDDGDGRGCA